jgi:hypothetical protein
MATLAEAIQRFLRYAEAYLDAELQERCDKDPVYSHARAIAVRALRTSGRALWDALVRAGAIGWPPEDVVRLVELAKANDAAGFRLILDRVQPTLIEIGPGAPPEQGEGKGGAGSTKPTSKRKRGRPVDTDLKRDKQIYDAWKTGRYKRQADCDRELGLSPGETYAACDRHRKRLDRRNKRRRTK